MDLTAPSAPEVRPVRVAGRTQPLAHALAAGPKGTSGPAAWLLRRPDDAITVQELADRYRSARRTPPAASLPGSAPVAMGVLVAKDSNA
jgi:hypothetical protein